MMIKLSVYLFIQLFFLALMGRSKSDPDALQDYCIADTRSPHHIFMNGYPCINPTLATTSHFATSALSNPGNVEDNSFGFNVTFVNTVNLPGLNTLGLTMSRVDIAANAVVPPHSHPRASEVVICLKGFILAGFVDTSNSLYTQMLRPGESFVFPKGLVHYLYNLQNGHPAVALSGFNSQNPGAQLVSMASFVSDPEIPDEVLRKGFKITGQDIARIRDNLRGTNTVTSENNTS